MKFVQGISASIWHAVLEDPAEDVRTFLKELEGRCHPSCLKIQIQPY